MVLFCEISLVLNNIPQIPPDEVAKSGVPFSPLFFWTVK